MGIVMYFDLLLVLLFGLIWICIATFLRLKKGKSLVFLVLFTIFYIYLFKLLDYTLFQFQSLIILKYFSPNLILNGQAAGEEINLIPLLTITASEIQTSLLNVLLFIPFGFGLPLITKFQIKKVLFLNGIISITIELLQFLSGLVASVTFRIADINDVIFNTIGAVIGYILFIRFIRTIRHIYGNSEMKDNLLFKYLIGRPQLNKIIKEDPANKY